MFTYEEDNERGGMKEGGRFVGITTSHGEVFYVSSMIQVGTGWRC